MSTVPSIARPTATRVLITGASSGVGAAVARQLAAGVRQHEQSQKLHLYLCGRQKDNLKTVSEECFRSAEHPELLEVVTAVGDVRWPADVDRMWKEFGAPPVDVLVANAGINRPGLLDQVSPQDYEDVMDTNVKGAFLWLQKALPGMRSRQRGQIVVTNSVLGLKPKANSSLYCASKYALDGLIGSLREEAREYGVKVGQVYPAGIATAWWDDPARGGSRTDSIDTSKFLSADDVAAAILMLIYQAHGSDIEKIVLQPNSKM